MSSEIYDYVDLIDNFPPTPPSPQYPVPVPQNTHNQKKLIVENNYQFLIKSESLYFELEDPQTKQLEKGKQKRKRFSFIWVMKKKNWKLNNVMKNRKVISSSRFRAGEYIVRACILWKFSHFIFIFSYRLPIWRWCRVGVRWGK